jgi:hypothetical protein
MTEFELRKAASFRKIKDVVTANVLSSTLKQQLHENKHITSLYMAQLAYFTFDKISAKLTEFGATRMSLYNHNGTQGFFAEFEDMAVVSFRGTQLDQSEDLKTCLTFWKQDYGEVKVHKGFANAIANLIPNITTDLSHVPRQKRIFFVGHSLGGALATLLSVKVKPDELVTFGAPRVAGAELEEYLKDVEYHRIVTSHDLVRWLPPDVPYVLPYKHCGQKRLLNVPWSWKPKEFIHPHLLVTYLNALLEEENLM